MTSRVLIYLILTVILFHVTAASDCKDYTSSSGSYKSRSSCGYRQFCCGTCNNRYCCSNSYDRLNQDACIIKSFSNAITGLIVLAIAVFVILTLICCCCPCCCLYNVCRKPRPVVGTSTTTVVNTQCVMQQPPVQGAQYPPYQPVPTQPPYGGQPYPAQSYAHGQYQAQPYAQGPYQAQPYAPGPPPPYQTVGPGYPSSQAAYPPTQAGFAPMPQPTDTSKQPPYNPAFMQPPPT
ncbi:protein shisa-5-like isoform X2 [Paramisgurnus dabryanus]|uniref:protein shisa-5-like isoform X2 n=1 Tax=Paramisgurnus dabryanus TaxID=90735 RepID=UPI0031F354DE